MTTSRPEIALINMPFAALPAPSIALSQLETVLDREFPDQLNVHIFYANHDFAHFLSNMPFYEHVMSNNGFSTGIGDWFFRAAAFPGEKENAGNYCSLYYPEDTGTSRAVRQAIDEKRQHLDRFVDEVIDKYDLAKMQIVGFTAIFSQTTASLAMARKLKTINSNIITVMGGPACAGDAGIEFARHFKDIDYVFSGCGLSSFPEFVRWFLDGNMSACEDIDGVFSRGKSNTSFGAEPDINTNITPDYTEFLDAFEDSFPDHTSGPRLLFETARGCWWGERMHCSFCGLNGPDIRFRAMTPDNALRQIQSVLRYNSRCNFFASVDNILPSEYLTEMLPHLPAQPGNTIQYEVRADLTEEQIDVLCKAGINLIQPGIESLSTSTLKLMRKGTSAFSNIQFLKACSKHPISLGWNLLIFSPGEEESTYQRFLDLFPLMTHLHPPLSVYPIEFVRYSRYVEHADEYGLVLQPEPFYSMTYPYDEQTIERMAQKFMDPNADARKIRSWLDILSGAIGSWRTRWLNEDRKMESLLCLTETNGVSEIYDSRNGDARKYPLLPATEAVLRLLEGPHRVDDVDDKLASVPGLSAQREISFLQEQGFLFEEDGRYLSLVVI